MLNMSVGASPDTPVDFDDQPVEVPLPPPGEFDPAKHVGRTEVYDFFYSAYFGLATPTLKTTIGQEETKNMVESTQSEDGFNLGFNLMYITPPHDTPESSIVRVEIDDVSMFFESYSVALQQKFLVSHNEHIRIPDIALGQKNRERIFEWSVDESEMQTHPMYRQNVVVFQKLALAMKLTNERCRGKVLSADEPPPLDRPYGVVGYHVQWHPPHWLVTMGGKIINFATHRWHNPAVNENVILYSMAHIDPTGILECLTSGGCNEALHQPLPLLVLVLHHRACDSPLAVDAAQTYDVMIH